MQPKRSRYRKAQKGRVKRIAQRGHRLAFYDFGLKVLESCLITGRQLEAVRVAISRAMERKGQILLRVFPTVPRSQKPAETRMGKGKGSPEYHVARVPAGTIIFEVNGVPYEVAARAMRLAGAKLGSATKMVVREDYSAQTAVAA